MAIVNVAADADAIRAAINSASSGDVIAIASGNVERFNWPASTTKTLSLIPQDRNNPPVLKGIGFGAKPDFYWPSNSVGTAKNVTLDGLRFMPELIAKAKLSKNSATLTDITGPDGRGWGWAPDFSYPGVTGLGAGSSMGFVGIYISGSGNTDITIKNCLFEQYTRCIRLSGRPKRIQIIWNEFSEICEDAIYNTGMDDVTISYNLLHNSRPLPKSVSDLWGYSQSPVHNDFLQCNGAASNNYCDGLTFSHNYIYDDSGRIHGILCTTSYFDGTSKTTGAFHRNILVEHNAMWLSQGTGFLFGDGNRDLTIQHNKIYKVSGSTPSIAVGGVNLTDTTQHVQFMTNIVVKDNVAPRFVLFNSDPDAVESEWAVSNNTAVNDQTTFPSTWEDPRPAKQTTPPHDIAGRYGDVGGVVPVTKPDPLTSSQWDFDDPVDDPNEGTNHQVGVIIFPAGSPALSATTVKWLGAGTTPQACVFIDTLSDGSKRWRMAGTLGSNSVGSGQTSENIGVYYATSAKPDLSDRSADNKSYSYKATTNVKTPITWQWDFTKPSAARWKKSPKSAWEDVVAIRFKKDMASPWELVWWSDDYVAYWNITLVGAGNSGANTNFPQPGTYQANDMIIGYGFGGSAGGYNPSNGAWGQDLDNSATISSWLGFLKATSGAMTLGSLTGVPGKVATLSIRGLNYTDPIVNAVLSISSTATGTICPVPGAICIADIPAKILVILESSANISFPSTLTLDGITFTQVNNNNLGVRLQAYLSDTPVTRNFAGGNVTGSGAGRMCGVAAFLRPRVLDLNAGEGNLL